MPDDLLKAGEFAHLCGTTKENVAPLQGYRAFDAGCKGGERLPTSIRRLQIGDYLLISSLQQAGCNLQEIKGYLSEPDSEALENVMEDRISAIVEQRRTLLMQKLLLEKTLARMRARNDWLPLTPPNSSSRRVRRNTSSIAIYPMRSFRLLRRICQPSSMSSSLCPQKRLRRSFRTKALTHLTASRSARSIPLRVWARQVDEQAERVVRHILDVWLARPEAR